MNKLVVFINSECEGLILAQAVKSTLRSVANLPKTIDAKIIIALNSSDLLTKSVACSFANENVSVVEFSIPSQSLIRNHCINLLESVDFVCFLNGMDLMSDSWLTSAVQVCKSDELSSIHPEYSLNFGGGEYQIERSTSSTEPNFNLNVLMTKNCWQPLMMARTSIFRKYDYLEIEKSFDNELMNWSWNMLTLKSGVSHVVAPGTLYFRRIVQNRTKENLNSKNFSIPQYFNLFK